MKKTKEAKKIKTCTALAVHLMLAGCGVIITAATIAAFAIADSPQTFNDSERINFTLFRSVSLWISALLLVLTLISRIGVEISKRPSTSSQRIAGVSPAVSAAAILSLSFFYTYLTYGGHISTEPFIISLGLGEALVFALPGGVRILFSISKEKKQK